MDLHLLQAVADELQVLKSKLNEGDFSKLGEIRKTVLQLAAPPQLVKLFDTQEKISF